MSVLVSEPLSCTRFPRRLNDCTAEASMQELVPKPFGQEKSLATTRHLDLFCTVNALKDPRIVNPASTQLLTPLAKIPYCWPDADPTVTVAPGYATSAIGAR